MTTSSFLSSVLVLVSAAASADAPPAGYDLLANGRDPDWFLSASGDHIVLGIGGRRPTQDQFVEEYRFRMMAFSEADGVRRWEASAAGKHIVVDNRRGPCHIGNSWGSENVRVLLDEREFVGCGDYSVTDNRR
jgi:hypothetical protein